MSEPQRRQVRVRRSPKITVFLLLGALIGLVVSIVVVNTSPPDATISTPQAIAYLALSLAPLGAVIGGVVALVLDRIAERRSRVVEAERIVPPPPAAVEPEDATEPVASAEADATPTAEPGPDPHR